MATDLTFVQYVCDQLRGAGVVTYRKMFGEYALYSDGKVVALLCDNQFFLKPSDEARALLSRVREGLPYPGARPHLLIDEALEDGELLSRLVALTAAAMPAPRLKPGPKPKPKPKPKRKVTTKTRKERGPEPKPKAGTATKPRQKSSAARSRRAR